MNRKSLLKVLITLVCVLLIFVGCSSSHSLDGKWISLYDDSIYYNFDNKGNYSTNYDSQIKGDRGVGTYTINNNEILTHINGNKEQFTFHIGYLYKNFICTLWDGVLPNSKKDKTVVSTMLGEDLALKYTFNSDYTYKYEVTNNGIIDNNFTENGTYTVNKNVVICTNNDGNEFIFFDTPNGILSAQYKRE